MNAPLLPALPGYDDPQLIAHGTTALVFRAIQTNLNRPVAIKVITVDTGSVPVNAARELATTVSLSSQPHIVSIIDTGTTEDDRPYIVMEYCEGGSYAQILRQRGPLPVDDVIEVGIKIGEALHAAHQVGIVHRDVKPSNILRSRFGPALTDFGIARAPDELGSTLTREMMTPHHASPEALLHQAQSGPSDIYSLASTLWTLLVGHPPFVDPVQPVTDMYLFRDRVLHEPLPPMERDDVPAWLVGELSKAMSKLPAQRHPTAEEFADSLRRGALGLDPSSRLRPSSPLPGPSSPLPGPSSPLRPAPSAPPGVGPERGAAAASGPETGGSASGGAQVHTPGVPAAAWPDARPVPPPPPPRTAPTAPPAAPFASPAPPEPALAWYDAPQIYRPPAKRPLPEPPPAGDPASADPRHPGAPPGDAQHGTAQHGDARHRDAQRGDARRGDAQHRDAQHGDAQRGDARRGDAARPPWVVAPPAVAPGGAGAPLIGRPPTSPTTGRAAPGQPARLDYPTTPGPRSRTAASGAHPLAGGEPAHPAVDEGGWLGAPEPPGQAPAGLEPNLEPWGTRHFGDRDIVAPSGGRRGGLLAVLVGVAVIAVASAALLALRFRGPAGTPDATPTAGGPTTFITGQTVGMPTDVAIAEDRGTSVTLTWTDPTAGTVSFVIVQKGSAGELDTRTTPPGVKTVTFTGLDATRNYCFTVGAVYTVSNVAVAPDVCTHR